MPLEEVTEITAADYRPRGMTPLNDAVAKTVRRLEKRVGEGDRAIVVVLTDGYENCSRMTSSKLRKLIIAKEQRGLGVHLPRREPGLLGRVAEGRDGEARRLVRLRRVRSGISEHWPSPLIASRRSATARAATRMRAEAWAGRPPRSVASAIGADQARLRHEVRRSPYPRVSPGGAVCTEWAPRPSTRLPAEAEEYFRLMLAEGDMEQPDDVEYNRPRTSSSSFGTSRSSRTCSSSTRTSR